MLYGNISFTQSPMILHQPKLCEFGIQQTYPFSLCLNMNTFCNWIYFSCTRMLYYISISYDMVTVSDISFRDTFFHDTF